MRSGAMAFSLLMLQREAGGWACPMEVFSKTIDMAIVNDGLGKAHAETGQSVTSLHSKNGDKQYYTRVETGIGL
jgi:hypothetical protein